MKVPRAIPSLIICVTLAAGCATSPISKTTLSGTSAAQRQEIEGFEVQAEAVTDKAKLKDLFGVESLGNDTLAVLLAGVNKQAQATVVKNNVTRREFKSATLQKGESTSGFLFFQVPEEQALGGIKLTVNISEAGTTSCETFDLNLCR
jgi:hypothetical protein